MGLNPIGLLSRQKGDLETNIQDQSVNIKMANYKPPRESWNRTFPRSLQKEPTLLTPWFWTSRLQNCETINFCWFNPPILCYFIMAANLFTLPPPLIWDIYISYVSSFIYAQKNYYLLTAYHIIKTILGALIMLCI